MAAEKNQAPTPAAAAPAPVPAPTPAPASQPTADAAAATDGKKAPAKRVEPKLTGVSEAMPLPTKVSTRGFAVLYPFDTLAAPQLDGNGKVLAAASFGVMNKTARDLAQTVGNANRKWRENKKDANGNIIYKMQELKDAAGNVVSKVPDTQNPEQVQTRHFTAYDVDPKTDKDGAMARVFRDL